MSSDRLLRSSVESTKSGARDTYQQLISAPCSSSADTISLNFLEHQLNQVADLPCDMPLDPKTLEAWMENKAKAVGERYANYLKARRMGAPREYFSCKSHALSFLQGVAPTKLVDGSWLYGVLRQWNDHRFHSLIRTYLEELGDGDPARNHVLLYTKLLAEHECGIPSGLSDQHYVQGAVQLALAQHTDEFLPEVIGYNLGYEQLPLHLLITAFELSELDIDPYYFTLHITIDNASTGHARKAVQSVIRCLPNVSNATNFMDRVAKGYRLNDLGVGTKDVIAGFDLEDEVVTMLERKADFGKNLHSDYCRIAGHTVNEWLATPNSARNFINTLESVGWIKRNENPANSRLWNLLEGERAPMAGVFNRFEKQLLRDWIVNDQSKGSGADAATVSSTDLTGQKMRRSFRPYQQPMHHHQEYLSDDCHGEIPALQAQLRSLTNVQRMHRLVELMAPSRHPSPAGLFATREFSAAFR